MYQVSFRGCTAKINRAKQHRNDLEEYIRSTFEDKRNRATLRADLEPESGYHIVSIQSVPDLSSFQENVGLMVGDVVHNLRSALDHLAWQLACLNTNGSPSRPWRVQFVIEDDPARFARYCNSDCLAEIDPAHQALIERRQPYQGLHERPDNWSGPYIHQLALLRDLSNEDKHRVLPTILLIPHRFVHEGIGLALDLLTEVLAMLAGRTPRPDLLEFIGREIQWTTEGLDEMKPGAGIYRARLVGPNVQPHMDMVGYATPNVALEERRAVIPTLDRIAAYVEGVIREFEPLFVKGAHAP